MVDAYQSHGWGALVAANLGWRPSPQSCNCDALVAANLVWRFSSTKVDAYQSFGNAGHGRSAHDLWARRGQV